MVPLFSWNGVLFTFVNGPCSFSNGAHITHWNGAFYFVSDAFNFMNGASIFWKWILLSKAISSGALVFVIGAFVLTMLHVTSTFVNDASIYIYKLYLRFYKWHRWCILFYKMVPFLFRGLVTTSDDLTEKDWSNSANFRMVHMNVVPRSTMNTNGETEN